MVASLQDTSLEEERFTQALQESHHGAAVTRPHPGTRTHSHPNTHTLPHSAGALPLAHESAMKWFYKDPQGEIQGTELSFHGLFLICLRFYFCVLFLYFSFIYLKSFCRMS